MQCDLPCRDPAGQQTCALLAEERSWRVSLPPPSSGASSPATGSYKQTQICRANVKERKKKAFLWMQKSNINAANINAAMLLPCDIVSILVLKIIQNLINVALVYMHGMHKPLQGILQGKSTFM